MIFVLVTANDMMVMSAVTLATVPELAGTT
jgi:hypothetical protein